MVAFLPGLVLAMVCVILLVYAFRAHERHWSLGFLGWRKVYTGLGISLAGSIIWALGQWIAITAHNPGLAIGLPIAAGVMFALGLALVVAGSMERLRDLALERQRLEELRAGFDLYDTLREVVSGPYTFLEVLEFALKEMVRAAGVTSGGLWLYNPSAREWILTGSANMSQNFRRQVETVRGSGTGFDRLARLHKAHVFSRADEIRLFFPEWEAEGIQSVLGLPLVTGTPGSSEKRLLGVIILADSAEARFDDDRTRRLHAAADYVAAVIAEGRLQRQLESSTQQMEALKSAQERDLESLHEQMRVADSRVATERLAWQQEMESRVNEVNAELNRVRSASSESLTLAQHQVDVVVARLEELRRATDEEKRRMTEDAQARMAAERTRYDQALTQIRTLETAQQSLGAQLEEANKSYEGERHAYDRRIEALDATIVREKQAAAAEHQRLRDALQQRIGELEMLVAGIEQEHERRMTELRSQVEEERHHSVDEQRVLKQEIQSLRMALADQQAHFASERDGLANEARQIESRYVQLLEAERHTHTQAREDWDSTNEASQQILIDLKLELENTRFEQGMALARAHNDAEQIREEYEERLSSMSDQVMMLEEALMAPPPGLSAEELAADPSQPKIPPAFATAPEHVTRELHSALLEWVAQQDQDEWHLELAAHDTPHIEMEWLSARLDEARRTCRDANDSESIGFAVRTASGDDRTTLRMTRLSATSVDEMEDEDAADDLPPAIGNVSRWLYDGDDRIGMEISFGAEAAVEGESNLHDDDTHDDEPQLHALSVLVVDDQVEMQDILTDMISSLGHESAIATTAKDGYARYINGAYDVILISADLPQEEGHTLAQWIKSHRVEMPVVMMADAGARDMIELVDSVLVKPFAIEQLHECLLTLTEGDFSGHVSVSGYDESSDD